MQKLILADDIIIDLYDLKYSPNFIGNVFHCSHYSIIRILKENNIKIRNAKEARQIRLNNEDINKRVGKSVSKYYKEHKIVRSEEEKKQISEKLMGHEISDETKKKISDSLKGRKLKPEHKKNVISAIRKRRSKQKIPYRDSKIELKVQKYLKNKNIAFETHKYIHNLLLDKYKYHQFDIIIYDLKLLIEVDGCYWHGCKECYKKLNKQQQDNAKRDKNIDKMILKSDWKVIRILEHNLKNKNSNNIEIKELDELLGGKNDG